MNRAKVLLADDHIIVVEGLQRLLEDSFDIVSMVYDGRALVETTRRLKPDVVVSDISMPLLNGLDAMSVLQKDRVQTKVIFLTIYSDVSIVKKAFSLGASGFLLKQSAGDELVTAIEQVLMGRTYISPLITKDIVSVFLQASKDESAQGKEKLSVRQREVLQLIAEGKTMKEIASKLSISTRTVESHKYEMMATLGVETTAELIRYAIKIGLVLT